ncbi:MAG: ATP-binding protein, partial [Streptomyces sp.]
MGPPRHRGAGEPGPVEEPLHPGRVMGAGASAGAPVSALGISAATRPAPCAMLTAVETRSVSPVFVGRTDELGVLNNALARAKGTTPGTGEPQALLLGGEAGVGKTRLIEE